MTTQLRYNTRGRAIRDRRSPFPATYFVGEFRACGASTWTPIEKLGAVARFHTSRSANVAAIEHVGTLGGLCTHEGTPE